jgi:hypothetical protein
MLKYLIRQVHRANYFGFLRFDRFGTSKHYSAPESLLPEFTRYMYNIEDETSRKLAA